MPTVNIKSVVEGDVLAKKIVVGEVVLFDAGTVLVKKSIDILTMLGMTNVEIEGREGNKFRTLKDAFKNIDDRFSYVENSPLMVSIKYLVKDVVSNTRGYR